MSRLLRSRAWSILALLAGVTSVWAGDVLWLRLGCAAGLVIGIAQQLTLLGLSVRMRMLGTFWIRLSAAAMLCAGVACWYVANSPRLPLLVLAGLLVVLAGLWWFCTALKDADVQPFTIVTTDALAFQRVAERYPMPVIYARRGDLRAIRAMLPKTVRAALYVFSRNNDDFLKVRRMTHVWLHHGDSDKEASCRQKSAAYDVLVVAGKAAIDRYAAHGVYIPSEKFKILGRPQVENIETARTPISTIDNPVVLYAPTWYAADYQKTNHSSLPIGAAIVSGLLARNATVIFRPHPANRRLPESAAAIAAIDELLRADAEVTSRPHRSSAAASGPTFAELANAADAMVSDVSGVATDFMQSLKPFAMVATGDKTDTFRARFPSSRSAYVIEWDLSTLDDALDAMLGDDPLASTRVKRREYYLGGYENGESARVFVRYLQSLTADPMRAELVPAKPPIQAQTTQKRLQPARQ